MKRLRGWDAYVQESKKKTDRSIELPLTEGEVYRIEYPTRKAGKKISAAQANGDVDALLVALLGKDAGRRVAELSENEPAFVLDELLLDVMRAFGFADEVMEAEEGKSSTSPSAGTTTMSGTPPPNSPTESS